MTDKTTFTQFSAVQKGISGIGIAKEGVNAQQRYNFRGIDQVMNTLAPLLAEHEVLIVPSVKAHNVVPGATKAGGVNFHHYVEVEYYIHSPYGDPLGPFLSFGESLDTSDKGLNKACTAAYKYWVLTALCVPLEGHEDADKTSPEAANTALTPAESQAILALCMKSNTKVDDFVSWMGYSALTAIPSSQYPKAIQALEQKLLKMAESYAETESLAAQHADEPIEQAR
tara:strand:+ start:442 stop:1122 length:681 start_codon:yes stop_codon:yes gene_type:complete